MNYTCAAVGAALLISAVTWFTTGKKNYTGPLAARVIDTHAIDTPGHKIEQPVDSSFVEVPYKQ